MLIARGEGKGRGWGGEDVGWGAGIDKKEPDPKARKREEKGHISTSSTKKKQLKGKFRQDRKKERMDTKGRSFGNNLPLLGYTEYEDDKSTKICIQPNRM